MVSVKKKSRGWSTSLISILLSSLFTMAGADPGGGLWGLETPPPQYIREAKGMMCCYKNT